MIKLIRHVGSTRLQLRYGKLHEHLIILTSSIGAGLASFQDGRYSSKMAAMAPIQDGVQAS